MLRIRGKLFVAYGLASAAVLVIFAWFAHETMRETLEAELGRRLVSIAQAAAAQIDGALVEGLSRALAEEEAGFARRSETYGYLRHRLEALRRATGVRSISVLDRDLRNLVDDTGQAPVGEPAFAREADLVELGSVFAGEGRASVLFTGRDGEIYKSGYAPVRKGDRIVGAVAIDAPAEFFQVLADLRSWLLAAGGALVLVVAAVSFLVAWRLSLPLRSLVAAAQAIGRGDFGTAIAVQGKDEVGFLARTMEEMRQRVQARDREMQMMLSGIAHEVRNPLGGIELYAGLLREELREDPGRLARVGKIERELAHLKSVVNDFLDYTRKVPLEPAPLDLEPYLAEILGLVDAEAEARGVRRELRVAPDATRLVADPDKLRRAILNLLRNAVQAMPGGGTLSLEARRDGGWLLVCVRDTGEGMPDEVRREIFTPFFTTRERGTGLGLAFVKKIAEAHGGEVRVETAPGEGTRVTLALPGGGA
jgi:signal transduction histidine kinase